MHCIRQHHTDRVKRYMARFALSFFVCTAILPMLSCIMPKN